MAQPSTTLRRPKRKSSAPSSKALKDCARRAVARIEGVHPTTVGRWVDRSCSQAKAADQEVITAVSTENVELDELYSFAGLKHPDEQESDLEEVGQQLGFGKLACLRRATARTQIDSRYDQHTYENNRP